ncbi:flagellar protein FliT [Pseudoduganella sp. UC29_106]|uniref:flagellar protein FliT n=1 Tax=Pseudoduganella sp. UC29_106 TaxID=3374553 RepID=UPI0037565CDC
MTNQEVLSVYGEMARLSASMLRAAQAAEWDRLEELEAGVSAQVSRLRGNEDAVVLDSAERAQKLAMIKQILDDDHQIRDLTMPWMAELSKLISSTGTERRLANAYGGV